MAGQGRAQRLPYGWTRQGTAGTVWLDKTGHRGYRMAGQGRAKWVPYGWTRQGKVSTVWLTDRKIQGRIMVLMGAIMTMKVIRLKQMKFTEI